MQHTFLGADDFADLPERGTIDPGKIRFSQNSIAPDFRDARFGSISDLAQKLTHGEIKPEEVDPIRIVLRDGKAFTLDNRRLKAFQDAGVAVPFVKLDQIPPSQQYKFTTRNDGIAVVLRDR